MSPNPKRPGDFGRNTRAMLILLTLAMFGYAPTSMAQTVQLLVKDGYRWTSVIDEIGVGAFIGKQKQVFRVTAGAVESAPVATANIRVWNASTAEPYFISFAPTAAMVQLNISDPGLQGLIGGGFLFASLVQAPDGLRTTLGVPDSNSKLRGTWTFASGADAGIGGALDILLTLDIQPAGTLNRIGIYDVEMIPFFGIVPGLSDPNATSDFGVGGFFGQASFDQDYGVVPVRTFSGKIPGQGDEPYHLVVMDWGQGDYMVVACGPGSLCAVSGSGGFLDAVSGVAGYVAAPGLYEVMNLTLNIVFFP